MSSSTPKLKLENKVAIITGGASGIGEETARTFALNGARAVVIADIQEEKGRKVAESIGQERCTFMKCDVSNEEQVINMIDSTIKLYGKLDIMFSNAGIMSPCKQDILDFNMAAYDNLFATNVHGMISCVKYAGKAMVDGEIKGSIICTSSVMGNHGSDSGIDYAMSKHAILGLVRCASKGLGIYGIRVNCVAPGPVPTFMSCTSQGMDNIMNEEEFEKVFQPDFALFKKGTILKAKHVADAVAFLASDDSEFVTGHNLAVDGGYVPNTLKLYSHVQLD